MADQVMKIDGDFKPYVNAAKSAEQATKRVAKEAGGIGDAVAKSIAKIDILKMGLAKAVQLLTQINTLNTEMSKGRDDRAIRTASSASGLGIRDADALLAKVQNRNGVNSTLAGDEAFLSSLASANKGMNVPLGEAGANSAFDLYRRSGDTISGENGGDFIKLMSSGMAPKSAMMKLIQERGGQSSQAAIDAVARQNLTDDAMISDQELRSAAGDKSRAFSAANKKNGGKARGKISEFLYQYTPDALQESMNDAKVKAEEFNLNWNRGNGNNEEKRKKFGLGENFGREAYDVTGAGEASAGFGVQMHLMLKELKTQTGMIQRANSPTPNLNAEVK